MPQRVSGGIPPLTHLHIEVDAISIDCKLIIRVKL